MTLSTEEQKKVEVLLNKIEELDDKLGIEFRALKAKYFKEKLPLLKQRDALLQKIPNFWLACLNNSPLSQHFNDEDMNVLQYITSITVEMDAKFDKITINFADNDLIENKSLSKTVFAPIGTDEGKVKADAVKWKKAPKRSKTEQDCQFLKIFTVEETEVVTTIVDVYESPIEFYEGDNDSEETKSNQTLSSNE